MLVVWRLYDSMLRWRWYIHLDSLDWQYMWINKKYATILHIGSSSYSYLRSNPKPYPEVLAFVCYVCTVASRPSPIYIVLCQ